MNKTNYYGFDDWNDVAVQFKKALGAEPEYVYAIYNTPPYSGDAAVVFYRDGKWFLVNSGHCSCNGLEGQWSPELINPETHIAAVKAGRIELDVRDSEGEFPEATQIAFDMWLEWAYRATIALPKNPRDYAMRKLRIRKV